MIFEKNKKALNTFLNICEYNEITNSEGEKIMLYFRRNIIIKALVILLVLAAVGGFIMKSHTALYISRGEALEIARKDAGIKLDDILETDVEFERIGRDSMYEIEIDTFGGAYKYTLDAKSGDIIFSL